MTEEHPPGKAEQHRQIDQKQRDALEVGFTEGVGDAYQEAAGEGAAKAAHAADDDHDESGNQDLAVHSRVEAEHGRGRNAAERRERYPECENTGEQGRDVGTEARRHYRIVDAGADHSANAAALEDKAKEQRDSETEPDQEETVRGGH